MEYAWRTDRGRVREHNEDAVAVQADLGLVVVADGVGGASAGEVASQLAADTIRACFQRQLLPWTDAEQARRVVEAAVQEANRAVWQLSQSKPDCDGMGTTLVLGFAGADWLAYVNVGDSRLYRLRGERLEQLSHDHSFIQAVVDQGLFRSLDDARRHGIGEHILTRALGIAAQLRATCRLTDLRGGDLYLFCTDGLTGMVPEDALCQRLRAVGTSPLESAAEALLRLANARGGTDNITLVLMRVGASLADDGPDTCAPAIPG
jgi:protein phosphatase